MQNDFNFNLSEKLDLPCTYNETKIVIIPRDLDVFFIYWNISNETIEELCNKEVSCDFFIRVRNSDFVDHSFIFHPEVFSKSWYFNISYTELYRKNIISDIGVYDKFGSFLILSSSNIIDLPNNFYFGKNYYYWQMKKDENIVFKDNKEKPIISTAIINLNSNEFCNYKVK